MTPEDNPADDVQPTKAEWEQFDAEIAMTWKCPACGNTGVEGHAPGCSRPHYPCDEPAAAPPTDASCARTPFQKWVAGDGPKAMPSYVYVASSWRNPLQQAVVGALKSFGMGVYDFKNPAPGNNGFGWREIDPDWLHWTPAQWREALRSPIARAGYALDKGAMGAADCCVLVLPCGRSAHLEAGYMAARGKPVFTLAMDRVEPELMTLLLGPPEHICTTLDELFEALGCPK
jgi:hypothetical protein